MVGTTLYKVIKIISYLTKYLNDTNVFCAFIPQHHDHFTNSFPSVVLEWDHLTSGSNPGYKEYFLLLVVYVFNVAESCT